MRKFKMPTDKQLIDIAILFNDGKLEAEKLADMVGMCQFVLERLHENNDVTKASTKENVRYLTDEERKSCFHPEEKVIKDSINGSSYCTLCGTNLSTKKPKNSTKITLTQ